MKKHSIEELTPEQEDYILESGLEKNREKRGTEFSRTYEID